ncbi:HNH endonuclease signature motif containing protein [Arthrobacter sp. zg-Y1116]|uniref:HNH endonuclease n=1 Tax=Arthrobacter sp. zg-Y1116 TaxID=2964611 RepID=UPI0021044B2F|nr:HNH endonuclease signature motif containing protein [Arthrobacter sp. zg-Y1116]MCQ1946727.1 HNH endonuclease [Arthrobacter sp. zg-Y1116]
MDQLGNTEWTTEEPSSEDQQPDGTAGETDEPRTACTLTVYRAEPAAEPAEPEGTDHVGPGGEAAGGFPDGFTGTLALQNLEAFDEQTVGEALSRAAHLISWGQALEARLINRMGELFRDDTYAPSERIEPGLAFSLAASECAAILNVPQVTGQRLLNEATSLCTSHTATLTGLEEGRLSYQHAQVVLEQCMNVPASALPEFEADLLAAAEGQTRSRFSAKARRLREKRYPETISKRHLSAFEQRKVTLDREEDGMSCLSAYLRAAEAQQIYTALSTAARGEQVAGDSRTTDQLRADILAQLLMGGFGTARVRNAAGTGRVEDGAGGTGRTSWTGGVAGSGSARVGGADGGSADRNAAAGETATSQDAGPDEGIVPRAEIMVLISAETLFGADEQPAELHGYGPISAEEARRLARNAVGWTGLAQNPHTGEILGVGRRRKVPAGLRRWLRARDGTCRFPGCRVNTANADIDHTVDWARGGPTDHGNLEHLCRRHHRFKTLGYWKACQPSPGVIEWTSPTGRVYRTEPFLEFGLPDTAPNPGMYSTREGREESDVEDSLQEQVPPF